MSHARFYSLPFTCMPLRPRDRRCASVFLRQQSSSSSEHQQTLPTTSHYLRRRLLQLSAGLQGPKTDLHPHIITKFGSHSHRYTRQISRERGPIGSLLLQPCSLQGPNTNTLTLIPSPNSDHTQHQTRTSRARA
jgi:hypothetical protein